MPAHFKLLSGDTRKVLDEPYQGCPGGAIADEPEDSLFVEFGMYYKSPEIAPLAQQANPVFIRWDACAEYSETGAKSCDFRRRVLDMAKASPSKATLPRSDSVNVRAAAPRHCSLLAHAARHRRRCACFLARRWPSAEKTASLWGPDSAKIARAS